MNSKFNLFFSFIFIIATNLSAQLKSKHFIHYWDSGQTIKNMEGDSLNGKREGRLIMYASNGVDTISISTYMKDRLEGKQLLYYKNGVKAGEYLWKKGEQQGFFTEWHSNKTLRTEGEFIKGVMHIITHLDSTGVNLLINGKGKYINYYFNYNVEMEAKVEAGKLHGVATQFYETGEKKSEVNYKMGLKEGPEFLYLKNGVKKAKYSWVNGKLKSTQLYDSKGDK